MTSFLNKILTICVVFCSFSCSPTQAPKAKALFIDKTPNQTTYDFGDRFSSDGLIVKDQDGQVVSDYYLSKHDGDVMSNNGQNIIVASKINYLSTYFVVNVNDEDKNQLIVSNMPNKVNYTINDNLDLSGLKITCNGEEISNYSVSVNSGTRLTKAGMQRINVSKQGYSGTHFNIYIDNKVAGSKKNINFYYLNDSHGAFLRKNTDTHFTEAGMSNISSYIKNIRSTDSNMILLSGGDMFQGGFESNQTHGLIMVEAMNIMKFDAMILGNHELDWGESTLKEISLKLDCPILSCNTFYNDKKETIPEYIDPFFIFNKGGVKIGIIGAGIEDMGASILGSFANKFYFPDPTSYIKKYSTTLRLDYGCDIIIAAMHDGGFNDETFKYTGLTYNDLKTGLPYVDGFFFAHDHSYKDGKINSIPYLESGSNCRKLGNMNFALTYSSNKYSIQSTYTSNISAYYSCKYSDSNIDALLNKYKDLIGDDELICSLSKDYTEAEFAALVSKSMYWYVNENKQFFNNETIYFASHNNGGIRADVSKGNFYLSDLVSISPFDNCLCVQKCTEENIEYTVNSKSLSYFCEDALIYKDNLTNAVTISYVAEHPGYSRYCQKSFVKYNFITAKQTVYNYLKLGLELLY